MKDASSRGNVTDTVVAHDFCCSCGVCAAVCPTHTLQMAETEYGEYRPHEMGTCADTCSLCLQVCPFSNEHCHNEDTLGNKLFGSDPAAAHYDSMGWVRDTFAGAVADDSARFEAPSGGLTTAVLCHLLESGEIDAALVLQPLNRRPWYQFQIAESAQDVLASRGSVYHVIPFDTAVSEVMHGPERTYAVVALPCSVKALRLAQERIPVLRRRLRYILGLTCGGGRSLQFADALTALMGGSAGRLRYRSKRHARNAHDYRAELQSDQSTWSLPMLGVFGYLWINEVGMLHSCMFCDDVFAELADATFMDAWLPEYEADCRGANLVISRNEKLSSLMERLFDSGAFEGGRIAPEKVEQSQRELLNRRRRLLPVRSQIALEMRGYAPEKRLGMRRPNDPRRAKADARREMAFFHSVRNRLHRWSKHLPMRPAWLARWHGWRLCWSVLLLACRHGCLGRTLRATKHLSTNTPGSSDS